MKEQGKIIKGLCILLLLLICILAGFCVYVKNSDNVMQIKEDTGNQDYKNGKVYMEFQKSESWESEETGMLGAQYDGVLYNFLENKLTDWELVIEFPPESHLDSYWNGKYKMEDGKLRITAVDYNEIIDKSSSIPIGFIMYTPDDFQIQNIEITVNVKSNIKDYKRFWGLLILILINLWMLINYAILILEAKIIARRERKQKEIIEQSLKTFAKIIDAKDRDTMGHSQRVACYAKEIARRMGMKEEECERISYIALLHDIGKMGVSENILQKTSTLDEDEWSKVREHVIIGGEILKDFTAIEDIADGAKYHHERYEGGGYTEGIKGEEIPLCARIICVADSYDAMASRRCYKDEMDKEYILKELREGSGRQFDPAIVVHMIEMIEEGFADRIEIEE